MNIVFHFYLAYFNSQPRGVSWLVNWSLIVLCALLFADPEVRNLVLAVTIKGKNLRLIGVYLHNDRLERADFSGVSKSFLSTSCKVVLAADWNAHLDPVINCSEERLCSKNLHIKPFRVFSKRSGLVDRLRNEYPRELV